MRKEILKILGEIENCLDKIDNRSFTHLEKLLDRSKKIFLAGTGRSGLVGRMFAMRLRQLGYESYVAGETITPPAEKGDIVIFISRSGERMSHIEIAKRLRKRKVKFLLITSSNDNTLSRNVDFKVEIPEINSEQFGNSLFEQCVFIFLEGFILYLKKKNRISQKTFLKGHTNLE